MKKTVIPLLLSVMFFGVLFLAGCSSKSSTTPAVPPTQITSSATEEIPSPEELKKWNYTAPEIPRVSSEELKQMIDRGDSLVLLDVRGQSSFKVAHIPGAMNIPLYPEAPLTQDMVNMSLLGLPRDKLVVLYCGCPGDEESGEMAQNILKMNSEFDPGNIKVLWKGYLRWRELDYPTAK
jgi:rhodanese-related sulfurtransferase